MTHADVLRIGCAAGFSGDRTDAALPIVQDLIAGGKPSVLMFETLAERTLASALKDGSVVVGEKTEKTARQHQRGNRLLVKTGGLARQVRAVAQLHVGRVVAQAGKRPGAQTLPGEVGMAVAKQRVQRPAVQQHALGKQRRVDQAL